MLSKNKTGKSLTYEEISKKLNISPQQVHKIEREAFNKLIKRLSEKSGESIFQTIVFLSKYLGIDTDQIYKKLNRENYDSLKAYVEENYERG